VTRTGEWFVPLHPSTLAGLRVSSGEQDSTQSERIQRSYERLKMRVGSRRSTPKQVCGGTPWEVDFSHGMAAGPRSELRSTTPDPRGSSLKPPTGRAGRLFFWPDVIVGVLFLLCAFWSWGITCIFSCFLLWEKQPTSYEEAWSFVLLFLSGTACYVAGWQITTARRSGFAFGLIGLSGLTFWVLLQGIWVSPMYLVISVALYCLLRAARLFGP